MSEQFHIKCKDGDVGKYVILTGDPKRCETIAAWLDDPHFIRQNREFTTYTGYLSGEKVSVVSTGIGGPSAAIALEELVALGAHTFLRVGTAGGMQPYITGGSLVIPSGAIRAEGTSREYLPIEFPAVPDFEMVRALVEAARSKEMPYHVGVVHCKDSFYGQHRPESMPVAGELTAKWKAAILGGALASEMESAALYTVAATRGVRCATVLSVLWNQETLGKVNMETDAVDAMAGAIDVAISAMRGIILAEK